MKKAINRIFNYPLCVVLLPALVGCGSYQLATVVGNQIQNPSLGYSGYEAIIPSGYINVDKEGDLSDAEVDFIDSIWEWDRKYEERLAAACNSSRVCGHSLAAFRIFPTCMVAWVVSALLLSDAWGLQKSTVCF